MEKEEKIYNKLILIGNGFDLALGLKTSYNDFLFWYLRNLLITSVQNKQRFDDRNMSTKYFYYKDELTTTYWNRLYDHNQLLEFIDRYDTLKKLQDLLKENSRVIIERDSLLFRMIYDSSLNSWVDIERTYYHILKSNLKEKKEVEKLNNDFNFLKNQLEIYLSTLKIPELKRPILTDFIEHFFCVIHHSEVIDVNENKHSIGTKNYYFLNFNYTDSLKQILDSFFTQNTNKSFKPNYQLSHIHGKLNSKEEKIIFGYGDEMDEKYEEIQDLNDNLFLENIKSFQYFRSPNYRNLLRFVNSNEYQVCIYGHSCGLSDRVMLNEIFENENCKSIKVYYYKDENDFNNKTMEISRHFKDNNSMRKKIVNFNNADIIPQLKED
ncbi:AbiH family protein [Polaribacter septentrionalilitoris]|uniref:AbiH family protein n=1 Tax=Polaribacter septentrionalilitoris TaxID=2494657 RepID=UPI0013580503|nr:AbiH family protein [Polaribacter septentrionalilitoris]